MNLKELEKDLGKIKIALMAAGQNRSIAFIQSIIFSLNYKFTDDISTAATNGLSIMFNPDFYSSLTKEEKIGLILHEAWHVALSHVSPTRKGKRQHKIWNAAGDFVINDLILKDGFTLPTPRLHDYKYRDWSTEDVYDDLFENADIKEIEIGWDDLQEGEELSPEEVEKLDAKLLEITLKAANQAAIDKQYGNIPSEIIRRVDDLINPKLAWNELLQRFLTSMTKEDYSWRKPSRRGFPEYYLPSQYSTKLENITVAIDTSGSVSPEMLTAMLSEINYIYETLKPDVLKIIDCDSQIHNVFEVEQGDDLLALEFSGYGGTSFYPVFDYCKENVPSLLIYFTDLYAQQIEEDPGYPVIWIVYDNQAVAPIGETYHIDI